MILPEQEQVAGILNRVLSAYVKSEGVIRPHFILAGESGTGKSHLIKTLTKEHKIPYLEINAAGLTKEGVSGNSLSKALTPLGNMDPSKALVIFVDEFDKLFTNGASDNTHEALAGVQNEFLTMLESETASVFGDYGHYKKVNIGKTLFVFAGAFNGQTDLSEEKLREMGVRTEFLGRVSLLFQTSRISLASMEAAVDANKLIPAYCDVFNKNPKTVCKHIKAQVRIAHKHSSIGVRLINQLVHQYFLQG